MEKEIDEEVQNVFDVFEQFHTLVRQTKWSHWLNTNEMVDLAVKLTKIYRQDYLFEEE